MMDRASACRHQEKTEDGGTLQSVLKSLVSETAHVGLWLLVAFAGCVHCPPNHA